MAIAFCGACNAAFENTRVGRGGIGGQCVICARQVCSDCAQKKCAICGNIVCNTHATTCKNQRVCNNHSFWQYLTLRPLPRR